MYGGQYPAGEINNDTSIKLFWVGIISYVIGMITPQFTTDPRYFFDSTLYTWDLLSSMGLGFIAIGIVLTYLGISKARLFEGVKKYTISGAFLVLIPILVIQSIKTDYRIQVGRDIVDYSIGYYALWLGVITSTIGSFKATSYPPYMPYGYNQTQTGYQPQYQAGYQQNQQPVYDQIQNPPPQQFQQPPVQPPSYIEPESRYSSSQPANTNQASSESQLEHNYCRNCGQDNDNGAKFCVNCGNKY